MARQLHLILASTRPRAAIPGADPFALSVTRMRVRPSDLDFYLHVNNGVYLQMMDVARSNYIADIGGVAALAQRRWYPVVAASTMRYRRSLTLGQRFEIHTRMVGWDERMTYLTQEFLRDGEVCARGLVAGRFLQRGSTARVPAPDVVELLSPGLAQPTLPEDVAEWAHAVGVAYRGD
ncbi:acyl-CoA thioesterase [Serinibacter arcticus]|uniref:Mesenchymal stem cell protein DSCD75 n=1 Tax=Serinibacter arcticus TaxID=1655435 RepID=A0A4Z1E357_9MICO|nr:acyl-CoA thioesterase [Serinibacter arcticus]TGO05690.1 Mesenchymal stem cell protein DSCD75 [Serinibacter arcticus]